jgi:hypothetical protein
MITSRLQAGRPRELLLTADAVLRGTPAAGTSDAEPLSTKASLLRFVLCITVFGMLYGAAMGTFGGLRPAQMLFSAIKVPLLLLVSGALSVPSLFVLYSLWGLRDDFAPVLRGLVASQVAQAAVLLSLAPFTLLWYASSSSYPAAVACNGAMFAIATVATQGIIRRHCRALIKRDPRHRQMLVLWFVLYAFIGIQMGWMLRPFIGDPTRPTTFLRPDSLTNAYEGIIRLLL